MAVGVQLSSPATKEDLFLEAWLYQASRHGALRTDEVPGSAECLPKNWSSDVPEYVLKPNFHNVFSAGLS